MTRADDFDRRERRSQWLTYVVAVAFYAGAFALCRSAYGTVLGFVVSSPVLGVYVSLLILHRGGGALRWAKWMALHKGEGRHHAFNDLPVRVQWHDGQCWVRAQDVFGVMGENPDHRELRRLAAYLGQRQFHLDARKQWWFGESGVIDWLEVRCQKLDTVALKFQRWLRTEVFPPMRRKRAP